MISSNFKITSKFNASSCHNHENTIFKPDSVPLKVMASSFIS